MQALVVSRIGRVSLIITTIFLPLYEVEPARRPASMNIQKKTEHEYYTPPTKVGVFF